MCYREELPALRRKKTTCRFSAAASRGTSTAASMSSTTPAAWTPPASPKASWTECPVHQYRSDIEINTIFEIHIVYFQGHCQDYEMGSEMCSRQPKGRFEQSAIYSLEEKVESAATSFNIQIPVVFLSMIVIHHVKSLLSQFF